MLSAALALSQYQLYGEVFSLGSLFVLALIDALIITNLLAKKLDPVT